MLSDAELTGAPRVVRDWSYTTNRMVGDGWILLGDAACFVDPLFSSGVHLALMS
ncbi:MAG TPA: FAD-binding protein, partial [Dehalococcoidia bacterium]|nr:FAD-binding protein [Dehalococcoidia bacterium]